MTVSPDKIYAEQLAWLERQQIHVSGRIAQQVYPKANPVLFEEVLRQKIDLSKYGDGLSKYFFTFIVLENTVLEFEGSYFNTDDRTAEIAVRIPLDEVLEASQERTIRLMENAYLKGVDLIGTLDLGASFDHDAFKRDVKGIFENPDWYESDLAAPSGKHLPEG